MKVVLFVDQSIDIDIQLLTITLDQRTKHVCFKAGSSDVGLDTPITNPESYNTLPRALLEEAEGSLMTFVFTKIPYDNNYFFQTMGNLVIVSLHAWDYLSSLPLVNGVVYFIVELLALAIENCPRHNKVTGCLFDFLYDKTGVDLGMRAAFICPDCLTRLGIQSLSEKDLMLLEDVQILLDDLGLASKWNNNLLKYWQSKEETVPNGIAIGESITHLDFLPDDNPENAINTSRESIDSVCRTYLKLRENNKEATEKGSVLEEFATQFFGLIKGWKFLDRDANLGDCEIDLIYDITAGPRVLHQRLGDNLYIECKNRTKKSDTRDISHFALNLMSRKVKSGIFFSMGGITGYQPDKWKSADAAYKKIVDLYRIHDVIVIPLVYEDVELVRNGGNLVMHLENLVNRFIRI